MRRKKTMIVGVLCVCALAALLCVALLGLPWLLTARAVGKVTDDPTASLSDAEGRLVYGYIMGDPWRRPFWADISSERQKQLVDAAVARTVATEKSYLLIGIANRWGVEGSFPSLPSAVDKAIRAGGPNLRILLATVLGSSRFRRFDPYVDVNFIMRGTDSTLIQTCINGLEMETLYANRDVCLEMLERPDVAVYAKRALLHYIAETNMSQEWFRDREGLLVSLGPGDDSELSRLAGHLSEQMKRHAPATREVRGDPVHRE